MAEQSIRGIWKVFFILLGITALEFIIALVPAFDFMSKNTKSIIYVILTLFKAFYIVAYFMHLKFERLNLIYTILVPLFFIVAAIVAIMAEAGYWNFVRDAA